MLIISTDIKFNEYNSNKCDKECRKRLKYEQMGVTTCDIIEVWYTKPMFLNMTCAGDVAGFGN